MESVVVIAPRVYDDEFKSRLADHASLAEAAPENVVVLDNGETRIYVAHNEYAVQEMEPEALLRIKAMVDEPVFYVVDFSDIDFARVF
jgi:hypothetical protein